MNFFEGRADGGDIRIGGLTLPGARHLPAVLTVGIRPEHVRLGAGEGASIIGTVEGVENLGHEKLWFLSTPEGRIIARTPDGVSHAVGERVDAHFATDKLHLFDRATGGRVEIEG